MIIDLDRVGDVVVQKVVKPDGSLVRFQYGKPGEGMTRVESLEAAKKELAPLVAKMVDRNGDMLVQKVTKNGEFLHYQYGNEVRGWDQVKTLTEARKAISKIKENA